MSELPDLPPPPRSEVARPVGGADLARAAGRGRRRRIALGAGLALVIVASVAVSVPLLGSDDGGDSLVANDGRGSVATAAPDPALSDMLTGRVTDPTAVRICLQQSECRTLDDPAQATWLRDAMSTAQVPDPDQVYCAALGRVYQVTFRQASVLSEPITVDSACGPARVSGTPWLLDRLVIDRVARAHSTGVVDRPAFPRGAITLDVCTGDTEQFCPVPGSQAERDRLAVLLSAGGLQRTGSDCGEVRQDLATITATYPGGEQVTARVGATCGPLRTGTGEDYSVLEVVRREYLQRVEVDDPVPSSPAPTQATSPAPSGSARCVWETPEDTKAARDVGTPSTTAPRQDRAATLVTNRGEIGLRLSGSATPCTVHSFVHLATTGFYDDTGCHRLTTEGIFVVQCGDPSGTGSGGPGYAFADEDLTGATYPRGTLAMANAAPGTNGSQFFMVYRDAPLPPSYTVFGRVDEAGLRVLEEVAAGGTQEPEGDSAPKLPLTITGVRLS